MAGVGVRLFLGVAVGETRSVWRVDRCHVCQKLVDRRTLLLMPHDVLQSAGSNYLPYSEPVHGTGWDGDATDNGRVSYGSDGEGYYESNKDNTWTLNSGAQTWEGAGSTWTTEHLSVPAGTTAIDVSAWTSLIFGVHVGRKQAEDTTLSVELGYCSYDGTNQQAVRTWSVKDSELVWFGLNVADMVTVASTEINFYVKVTPSAADGEWWVQDAFLIKNPASITVLPSPLVIIKTSGTAVEYATDTVKRATLKTCPACREQIFGYAEDPPRPTEPDAPIQYFTLEEL